MIKEFIQRFEKGRPLLEAQFTAEHPGDYQTIVKAVVEVIGNEEDYYSPDPNRIHTIDDGDYQGTLVYVIGARGYQPDSYWFVKVGYGSCSGCDTLESISNYSSKPPTAEQVKDYMGLALNIVQGIKSMQGVDDEA